MDLEYYDNETTGIKEEMTAYDRVICLTSVLQKFANWTDSVKTKEMDEALLSAPELVDVDCNVNFKKRDVVVVIDNNLKLVILKGRRDPANKTTTTVQDQNTCL